MNMSLTDETILTLADDVTFQSMGEGQETVVLSLESGYLYTCNATTEAFLKALDGKATLGQILGGLEVRFDVKPERLRKDILALAARMIDEKLILIAD